MRQTDQLQLRLQRHKKGSETYDRLVKEYDAVVQRWVDKVHRLGASAKGLWLVDFDMGKGCLCWMYPEKKVDYFHSYEGGYKKRVPIKDLPLETQMELFELPPADIVSEPAQPTVDSQH